ncbi:site-specific DNA-methyltransferase [[Mycobacterium] vasticus]|uniref:Site-specific DNA-methyltransferase n=1 Tax=[Mycobacterium] vasticus TaxID=2875777 RepID=A0ABU5YYZ0_9MYCO|nr:site-specific DNA-methyltransferase [Mycolicibacter sp. MYC017]MEB3070373.1 site-specific DNA-methyltransferase [Mycolicibacter sp. MYC017]
MARKKTDSGPTPVEAIQHSDKRTNIPTADAQEFIDPSIEGQPPLRYPRDPSLDPQLVWRGKDKQDSADLLVDAPPIYIQEKIDPRVLIENLRRTAEQPEDEPELSLFDSFDGLDELSQLEFYQHPANWSNRMILGDSLQVMGSLAERELLRGKVQMVYLDPPYGIKFGSNWQVSARKRDVKDGKLEDAAREAEQIKAFRDTWDLGISSYLSYLRDRLVVARDLLTESGSCFVQIGDENVHLVRSLMDEVFGSENFVSQIAFATTAGATSDFLAGTIDYIIWYAKDRKLAKFRQIYLEKTVGGAGASKYSQTDDSGRLYRIDNLTSQSQGRAKGEGAASWFPVEVDGHTVTPTMQSRWKTNRQGMERLQLAGRVARTRNTLGYVRYLEDFPAFAVSNSWTDIGGVQSRADPKIYVVQTATRTVERCLLMCTDPGDLVLDPTCGSGTTAFVAEQWGRRWITVDTSRVALALARQRLMGAKFPYYLIADSEAGKAKEAALSGKPAAPGPVTNDIRHGFVYERVQHITLKSIANNPDIKEGMSREQIDAAIKRHADFEQLYDKPYEDTKKVRVTGPFTVESLSPHRSLAFAGTVEDANRETISQAAGAQEPDNPSFEQSILDNLTKAGIQNGKRQERIEFAAVESYAGEFIQAVGERPDGSRVGLALGPQYGTVSPSFIKSAAKEAIRAGDIELLCVLGFAFDPQATGVTEDDGVTVEAGDDGFANVAGERRLGRIPVLLVRMNADLLIGEDLKKTGAGNLFTVFGEPDIELRSTDDGQVVVELRGVDVYDPTTGEIRNNDTGQIALWMIDTNYDEESFFVRHCYFTGGNDPYRRLKTSLKADIDVDAWDSLYRTESRPFAKPATGKIAVKVINDYGDEVMKVFEV